MLRSSTICIFGLVILFARMGEGLGATVSGNGEIQFDNQIKPLLAEYCYGCHGETKQKADLSLHSFQTEADALKDRLIWERVLRAVQTKEMPPESKPQPSEAERDLVSRWIETKILHCDCSKPDPGRVTIRRLNRTEYNNTIRDLLGVNFRPADDFPNDDSGYGFDNIGDVLSLSPVLFEKYMAAAEAILDQAIISRANTNGPAVRFPAAGMDVEGPNEATRNKAIKLTREGHLKTAYYFPKAGSYLIRIRAWGDHAGDEPPKLQLRLGDNVLNTFDVKGRFSSSEIFQHRFDAAAGRQEIFAAYINNFRDPENPDPEKRDRNLAIEFVDVIGPSGLPDFPETHQRIFRDFFANTRARQAYGESWLGGRPHPSATRGYALQIVSQFAGRAFRRPVTETEVDRLMNFYDLARADGETFEGGVKLAFSAILVSPHFLFRGELQPEPDNPALVHAVDEFSLASRVSYFLWSTMPDDELLRLAARGKLRSNLEGQVKRMLRDRKAESFVRNFVGQWLQLRNLQNVQPDPATFPGFDEELRSAMQRETELLFANVMQKDRPIIELVNARYTFVNNRLAKHYGLNGADDDSFRKVKLKSDERGGVLTHASILTITSNSTRTSPVKRGKFVLENILGTPPPPPPPDVPELKEAKDHASGTLRQRLEQHRADPACANCHARMDPIGFGLENFDGIGAWRTQDGDLPVDTSGTLVSGEDFQSIVQLKKILAEQKKDEFARCLTEKMLTYALGRGVEFYDKCALDKIGADLAKHDYKFSRLIYGIVNSTPFQMRRGEGMRVAAD